jgi:uncharacterized protein YdaU (DUF1376 family)
MIGDAFQKNRKTIMAKLKWYKRDPVAYLHGTRKLSLEERGAYSDILELIYSHDGRLENDDNDIAGWLRIRPSKWIAIKDRLVSVHKKLSIVDGFIVNNRCTSESISALKLIENCEKAGKKSGESRRSNPTISVGYDEQSFVDTDEKTDEQTTTTTTTKPELESKEDSPPIAPPLVESVDMPKDGAVLNEAVTIFNEAAERFGLPACQKLTSERSNKLRLRLSEAGGIEAWRNAINHIGDIPGLMGTNDRGWRVSIDFLLKPGAILRINEGAYDNWNCGNGKKNGNGETNLREWLVREAIEGPFGPMAFQSDGSYCDAAGGNTELIERQGVPLLRSAFKPN